MSNGLTRRGLMQRTAIAGGALAVGGAASSGSAAAAIDGSFDGTCDSAFAYAFPISCGHADPDDDVNNDPEADAAVLHNLATSTGTMYDRSHTTAENYLQDTETIAFVEGRNGLADAYEDGQDAIDADSTARLRIRGYYDIHKIQQYATMQTLVLQFAYIAETAQDDGDLSDTFLAGAPATTDATGDPEPATLLTEYTEATIDLDGDPTELHEDNEELDLDDDGNFTTDVMPTLVLRTTDTEYEVAIGQELFDSWDSDAEQFVLEDDDGNEWTWDGWITLESVGDPEDGGLESVTPFDFADFMDLWTEIEGQSTNMAANFDQSMAEDMFALMDDGTLSPSDVRGAAGTARFLSGTDDLGADSFRMSLFQQLNMEQPDLTKTASMKVRYTGYDGYRGENYVEDGELEGLLFAKNTPRGGFETGRSYFAGGYLYVGGSEQVHGYTPTEDPEQVFHADGLDRNIFAMEVSNDGRYLAVVNNDDVLYMFDTITGEIEWEDGSVGRSDTPTFMPDDGSVYGCAGNDGLVGWDVDTGEQILQVTGTELGFGDNNPRKLAVAPNGEDLLVSGHGSHLASVDPDTGDTNWITDEYTSLDRGRIRVLPDGDLALATRDTQFVFAFDPSDGSKQWEIDFETTGMDEFDITPDGDLLIAVVDDELYAVDVDTQDTEWVYDLTGTDATFEHMIVAPGGGLILAPTDGGELYALDRDGSTLWVAEDFRDDNTNAAAMVDPGTDADGVMGTGLMYDAVNSAEIETTRGLIEVVEMTDRDGNEIDHGGEDWGRPEYATDDNEEYALYLETIEELREQLESEDGGGGGTSGGDDDGLSDAVLIGVLAILGAAAAAVGLAGGEN